MSAGSKTYTPTNKLTPNIPQVSAYYIDLTGVGAGAYGFDTAANAAAVLNALAALVLDLKTRNAIAAS